MRQSNLPHNKSIDTSNGLIKSFAKIGLALENIFKSTSPSLLAFKLADEETKQRLEGHLSDCENKLNAADHEDICKAPDSISIPIVNELILLDKSSLSEAFVNLLSKSATCSTLGDVHPGFIGTLKNMSADEAKILMHIKDEERIPTIDLTYNKYKESIPRPESMDTEGEKTFEQLQAEMHYNLQEREAVSIDIGFNLTALDDYVSLDFATNIHLYIYNLNKLGLIDFVKDKYYSQDEDIYKRLTTIDYTNWIEDLIAKEKQLEFDDYKIKLHITRGYIRFSQYGKAFINACIRPIEKK